MGLIYSIGRLKAMDINLEMIENWTCAILHGAFIVSNTEKMHQIINEVSEIEASNLVIDITDVPFMDSSAIGVLFAGYKILQKHSGQLAIYGANEVIMDVFKAVQLSKHVKVYQNRGDFIHQNFS